MRLLTLTILATVPMLVVGGCRDDPTSDRTLDPIPRLSTLSALLALPATSLAEIEVTRMNLLCGEGLPGAEGLDCGRSAAVLAQMRARVQNETERHLHRFRKSPMEFENSESFFKMVMMGVVLAEDFQIKYAPAKIGIAANAQLGDGFFADSCDVFLHGLLGPSRRGTCSSLPVLYVAIGRKLGYPLKLVTTKGHLFVRWEDSKERFNIEVTSHGVNKFPDDYYRHWPMEVTDEEVKAEGYLKSLSPAEELAVFLSIRGMCLREAGRINEAAESFAAAARLAPECRSYELLARALRSKANP